MGAALVVAPVAGERTARRGAAAPAARRVPRAPAVGAVAAPARAAVPALAAAVAAAPGAAVRAAVAVRAAAPGAAVRAAVAVRAAAQAAAATPAPTPAAHALNGTTCDVPDTTCFYEMHPAGAQNYYYGCTCGRADGGGNVVSCCFVGNAFGPTGLTPASMADWWLTPTGSPGRCPARQLGDHEPGGVSGPHGPGGMPAATQSTWTGSSSLKLDSDPLGSQFS